MVRVARKPACHRIRRWLNQALGCHAQCTFIMIFYHSPGSHQPGICHSSVARAYSGSVFGRLVKHQERHICFCVLGWDGQTGAHRPLLIRNRVLIGTLVDSRTSKICPDIASTPFLCISSPIFPSSTRYPRDMFHRRHAQDLRHPQPIL